jgi:hypothetical protein
MELGRKLIVTTSMCAAEDQNQKQPGSGIIFRSAGHPMAFAPWIAHVMTAKATVYTRTDNNTPTIESATLMVTIESVSG